MRFWTYALSALRNACELTNATHGTHSRVRKQAVKWLSSRGLAKKEVAMACEVQLMYKPYYFYRKNVHFLYKVCFKARAGVSIEFGIGLKLSMSVRN